MRTRTIIDLVFLWVIAVPSLALLSWSLTRYTADRHTAEQCVDRMNNDSKGFAGNADVYGLGIRLGIYCQWAAQALANIGLPTKITRDMAAGVLLFDLALLVAALLLTFRNVCAFTVEIYIILFIFWGSIFAMHRISDDGAKLLRQTAMIPLDYRRRANHRGMDRQRPLREAVVHGRHEEAFEPPVNLMSIASMVITCWAAASVYGLWFCVGQYRHPDALFVDTPGGGSFFLFRRVSTDSRKGNGFLIACNAIALSSTLLVVVWYHSTLFPQFYAACVEWIRTMYSRISKSPRYPAPHAEAHHDEAHLHPLAALYMASFSPIGMIYSIIAVETTLVWNNISSINEVTSTGQVIALVVGVGNLLTVMMKLFAAGSNKRTDDQDTEASSLSEEDGNGFLAR